MENITPELNDQAKQAYQSNDFETFIECFFSGFHTCEQGVEFETWTSGGVNMVHFLHEEQGDYFKQFIERANDFDIDEEIDIHRQDPSYRNHFTIRRSVEDFEKYEKYLTTIAELIN